MPTQKPSTRINTIARDLYRKKEPSVDLVCEMIELTNCRIEAILKFLDETAKEEEK